MSTEAEDELNVDNTAQNVEENDQPEDGNKKKIKMKMKKEKKRKEEEDGYDDDDETDDTLRIGDPVSLGDLDVDEFSFDS